MKRKLACLIVALLALCVGAAMAETQTVSVTGTYGQTEARSMLKTINALRTGGGATYVGEDGSDVHCGVLSELVYDYGLERTAMQRAIEIAMKEEHTRPNGSLCYTAFPSGYLSAGENIASGPSTAAGVYTVWLEDNVRTYSGQGHRRNMLSSNFNRIGIGHVVVNGRHYWTQAFGNYPSATGASTAPVDSALDMDVAIDLSLVDSVALLDSETAINLTLGGRTPLPSELKVRLKASGTGQTIVNLPIQWSVSDLSVARIETGSVVACGVGSTTLNAMALGKSLVVPVTVAPVNISAAVVSLAGGNVTYNGQEQRPDASVVFNGTVLVAGTDYTLSYSDNVNAGKATVIAEGTGNYTGSAKASFTIEPAEMSGATLAPITPVRYTGAAIEPATQAALGEVALVQGTDYTVAYANNVNAGQAALTLTGTGNYTGALSGSFAILPADMSGCAIASIPSQLYTGSAIEPALTVTFSGKKLVANTDYTAVYSNNTAPGTAAVTLTGVGNFEGTAQATFVITDTASVSTGRYKLGKSGTATYLGPVTSRSIVKVPDTVKAGGRTYKVTAVADKAFYKDKKLTTLTLGKNVKTLGKSALYNCTKFKTLKGGDALTTISASAFRSCTALKTVTLTKSVKTVGATAFYGCKALKTVTLKTTHLTSATVGANAFKGIAARATFTCPKAKLAAYEKLLRAKGAPASAVFK